MTKPGRAFPAGRLDPIYASRIQRPSVNAEPRDRSMVKKRGVDSGKRTVIRCPCDTDSLPALRLAPSPEDAIHANSVFSAICLRPFGLSVRGVHSPQAVFWRRGEFTLPRVASRGEMRTRAESKLARLQPARMRAGLLAKRHDRSDFALPSQRKFQ